MQYDIIHNYRDDGALRASFNELAMQTFGLDFEPWYQNGFWTEAYDPHSVLVNGQVAANVSVNRIDGLLDGKERHYIQLGTVMTRPEYRNRGMIRAIMDYIKTECADCDGLYLYAGDDVLSFYPKFGFVKAPEVRWQAEFRPEAPARVQRVSMECMADWQAFLQAKKGLGRAAAFAPDTDHLTMFYITQFMKDCLYYLPGEGAYIVAEANGDELEICDVLSPAPVCMREICAAFGPAYSRFVLSFTPLDTNGFIPFDYVEEDCTFFVQGEPLMRDIERIGSFSAITHA